ncbi:MAG TPA: fatty acid desaturase [Planctomycetota bacterium]
MNVPSTSAGLAAPDWAGPSPSLPPERREALRALHDDRRNRAAFPLLATYLLLGGAVAALILKPGPLTFAVVPLAIGVLQYRLIMACHEAVHRTLFFPAWLNEAAGVLCGSLVGLHLTRYRSQHLAHHDAPALSADPDAYIYEPVLRARPGVRRAAVWFFGAVPELFEKFRQKSAGGGSLPLSLAILAAQGALLGACALWLKWWYYPVFWAAPLVTIALFLNRTRVIVEHGWAHLRVAPDALPDAPVLTFDLRSNPLERFIIAPFLFNFHGAHHSSPSVPHYNNPRLAALLAESGRPVVRVEGSYLGTLLRILRS